MTGHGARGMQGAAGCVGCRGKLSMKTVGSIITGMLSLGLFWCSCGAAQVAETSKRVVVPDVPGTAPTTTTSVSPTTRADTTDGQKWALLVGINKYPNLPKQYWLQCACNDAVDLKTLLTEKYAFPEDHITLLRDSEATKKGINSALAFYSDKRNVGVNDQLLVFFSGHGQTVPLPVSGKEGYLLPYDASVDMTDTSNPGPYEDTCLSMSSLRVKSESIQAKHVIFLIDACYGGLALENSKGLDQKVPDYLDHVAEEQVRQIITAGGENEPCTEDPHEGHGLFTSKLLIGLRTGKADLYDDGVITGQELGTYLIHEVSVSTHGLQNPKFGCFSGEGQFLFGTLRIPSVEDKRRRQEWDPTSSFWKRYGSDLLFALVAVMLIAAAVFVVRGRPMRGDRRAPAVTRTAEPPPAAPARVDGGLARPEVTVPANIKPPVVPPKAVEIVPDPPPAPAVPPLEITCQDDAKMVLIPAGEFQMGSDAQEESKPIHSVSLHAFYMDRCAVTNEQYARFLTDEYAKNDDLNVAEFIDLNEPSCPISRPERTFIADARTATLPVIFVSWQGAKKYAEHFGKRLPTEAEWELAARGPVVGGATPGAGSIGDEEVNYGHCDEKDDVRGCLKPVEQSQPNGYGLHRMQGNVFEWCEDWHGPAYYQELCRDNPTGPESGRLRVIRGGAWSTADRKHLSPSWRAKASPEKRSNAIGFRCVKDIRS